MLAGQDSFGLKPWRDYAAAVGVSDLSTFDSCLERGENERIRQHRDFAQRIGVRGTPTVIVNGWKLARTPAAADLRRIASQSASGFNRPKW